MSRPRPNLTRPAALLVVAALVGCGCDMGKPYRSILRDQTAALLEVESILQTINDQNSMVQARSLLEARFEQFDSIQARARDMTPPTPEISQELLGERDKLKAAMEKVQGQVRRVSALPDGPAFFKGLGGKQGFLGGTQP